VFQHAVEIVRGPVTALEKADDSFGMKHQLDPYLTILVVKQQRIALIAHAIDPKLKTVIGITDHDRVFPNDVTPQTIARVDSSEVHAEMAVCIVRGIRRGAVEHLRYIDPRYPTIRKPEIGAKELSQSHFDGVKEFLDRHIRCSQRELIPCTLNMVGIPADDQVVLVDVRVNRASLGNVDVVPIFDATDTLNCRRE